MSAFHRKCSGNIRDSIGGERPDDESARDESCAASRAVVQVWLRCLHIRFSVSGSLNGILATPATLAIRDPQDARPVRSRPSLPCDLRVLPWVLYVSTQSGFRGPVSVAEYRLNLVEPCLGTAT